MKYDLIVENWNKFLNEQEAVATTSATDVQTASTVEKPKDIPQSEEEKKQTKTKSIKDLAQKYINDIKRLTKQLGLDYGTISTEISKMTQTSATTMEEAKKKSGDRCTRIAKRKYKVWPSAYASGAVVKCRQGKIWKGISEDMSDEQIDYFLIIEQLTYNAPQGVLFINDNKVLVGDNHHDAVQLSEDLHDKILEIGKKHGYYGEGSGIEKNKGVLSSKIYKSLGQNKAKYKGSWDDMIKIPNDEKYVYIATVFSNPKENERVTKLLSKVKNGESIFSLLSREVNNHTQSGLNLGGNDVKKFLKQMSENNLNFIELSKKPATKENLEYFIYEGEKLMWPSNWHEYPNKAGKLARRETIIRDKWLAEKAPSGVFFIGSGHLKDISKMTGINIIGGSSISSGSSIDSKQNIVKEKIDDNQDKHFKKYFNTKQLQANKTDKLEEKWSQKYKRSIDCNNPKGFSQKAHCQGKKKK